MTSLPFVRRTFATLRMAEFGFLGVRVMTCTHTPRRKGLPDRAGDLDLVRTLRRPLRTSWLMVGIRGESEMRRKGKDATLRQKPGKNFLRKMALTREIRDFFTRPAIRSVVS